MKELVERWRQIVTERMWPISALLLALSAAATFGNAPGVYIGDDRYDQFASPGARLAHSIFLWDGTRGLGRVREDIWLGFNVPLALLRSTGMPIWATERAFHAGLIALGGIGVVGLLRVFWERIRFGHLMAALVYSFGPYSAAFLQPSNLYAEYAAAPWLGMFALRGLTGDRPWRCAAGFAVTVFLLGNADPPGVIFAALVVVPILLWAVWVEHSISLRRALGWLARAAVLTVATGAAALFKTWVAAATFSNRLDTTESPALVNMTSSWSESLRGLGFWLLYYRGAGLARPQSAVYFGNAPVILATFAIPFAAFAAIAGTKGRERLFFAGCLLAGTIVMVGSFPISAPTPYGHLVGDAYNVLPSLAAFRTSYKMGAVLCIGLAGLIGLGITRLRISLAAAGRARLPASLGALALLGIAAMPFWTGHLYNRAKGYTTVPTYWSQAVRYVDDLPGTGRVLVLPGTTQTQYRWGWVGDDILDAMLHRDHAVDTAIPLSEPEAANLLHAVTESVADGTYQPGSLAPILRRLGITYVLIRNDVDWAASRTYRPARLEALRHDPDMHLLKTFGRIGENTTAPGDHSSDAALERTLPPIEVYSVADAGPAGPRVAPADQKQVLVSGDGSAWPEMARDGDLTGTGPVRYSGDVSDAALPGVLADTDRVIITDTNRRTVDTVDGFSLDVGPTLAAGQNQDRPATDLFKQPDSQTVAWFPDATTITTNDAARGLNGADPANRPAAAFDGNSASSWLTFESNNQTGLALRVDFRQPTLLKDADITLAGTPPNAERILTTTLAFSDGSTIVMPFAGPSAEEDFKPRTVSWVEILISQLNPGAPHSVGYSEISFTGVDLHEWISMPSDLADRAAANPKVAAELADLPLTFQMERLPAQGQQAVEPVFRRRFKVPGSRTFTLTANLRTNPADTLAAARALGERCGGQMVTMDGKVVPVRLAEKLSEVKPGAAVPLEACAPIALSAGWHELQVVSTPVGDLWLKSPGSKHAAERSASSKAVPQVTVLDSQPGHYTLKVDAPDGGTLISSQSYEQRWVAVVNGHSLGDAGSYDTLSGWQLPPGTDLHVTLDYRPQQRFGLFLALSAAALAVCVGLLFSWSRPARHRRRGPGRAATHNAAT